jgi:hypothetical protein
MKSSFLLPFTLVLMLFSCKQPDPNKQVDEGTVKNEVYKSAELGWEINLPKGWEVITKDKMAESTKKGGEAIAKSTGQEINTKGVKNLICIKKDKFNTLLSTSEASAASDASDYPANTKKLYALLFQTFAAQGIKADTSSGIETIQGHEFYVFHDALHGKNGEIIVRQTMYSTLLNGNDFAVTLMYNNDADRDTLLKCWRNSRFTKK